MSTLLSSTLSPVRGVTSASLASPVLEAGAGVSTSVAFPSNRPNSGSGSGSGNAASISSALTFPWTSPDLVVLPKLDVLLASATTCAISSSSLLAGIARLSPVLLARRGLSAPAAELNPSAGSARFHGGMATDLNKLRRVLFLGGVVVTSLDLLLLLGVNSATGGSVDGDGHSASMCGVWRCWDGCEAVSGVKDVSAWL